MTKRSSSFPKLILCITFFYNCHTSPCTLLYLPYCFLSPFMKILVPSVTFQTTCLYWDRSSFHNKLKFHWLSLHFLNVSYVCAVVIELKILVILKKRVLLSISLNDTYQEQTVWSLFLILQLCYTICFSQNGTSFPKCKTIVIFY